MLVFSLKMRSESLLAHLLWVFTWNAAQSDQNHVNDLARISHLFSMKSFLFALALCLGELFCWIMKCGPIFFYCIWWNQITLNNPVKLHIHPAASFSKATSTLESVNSTGRGHEKGHWWSKMQVSVVISCLFPHIWSNSCVSRPIENS